MLGILGRINGRELVSPCPLHNDRNPSFSLNTESGLWQCFSRCGAGNFIQLVEKKLGYTRQEAQRWIETNGTANSLNVLTEQLDKIFAPPQVVSEPVSLGWRQEYDFYNASVMPQWFLDRGFTWDTINHWRIVYNPITDCLIIPVFWEGQIIGTVKRNTDPSLPKYENSWDLPVERIFFGEINRSRRDIILCEGLLDAIWLWQLGYHAVSILGSSLTVLQVKLLNGLGIGEITLAFDNDAAGKRATDNAIGTLMGAGWMLPQIKILRFPGQTKEDPNYRKDPQECSPQEIGILYNVRTGVLA